MISVWFVGGLAVAAFPVFATLVFGFFVQEHPLDELLALIAESLAFPLLMALLVAPLGIWWSILFSNRIVGPVVRFNRDIARLLAGEPVADLKLRDKDFFRSLESTYLEVRNRIDELKQSPRDAVTSQAAAPDFAETV